jgi:NADH-quinone oxidoreductase subunit M
MILTLIFFILFVTLISLFFIPKIYPNELKILSLVSTGSVLILSLILFVTFDQNLFGFQYFVSFDVGSSILNIEYFFGIDGLSIFFFSLSNFLIFLCVLFVWTEQIFLKEYLITLIVIDILLLLVFSSLDLLLFYVFFEAILIPMYLMIGLWGSRDRKIRASYLFFFYTLFTSVLMLIGLLYIYSITGTLNIEYLSTYNFTFNEQYWLWLSFFFFFFI